MTEENYGKIWCLDPCLPLSKTNLSNKKDMYVKHNIIKSDRIDYHLYLLQEVKAIFFKLNNDQQEPN